MAKTPTRNVDLFKVLADINTKNRDFYRELTTIEQKALHPLVLMKWMSGTNSELQIMLLNEFANKHMFALSSHKELLMELLVVCSPGSWTKYQFPKTKSAAGKNTSKLVSLVKETYKYSTNRAVECLPLFDDNDLMEMAVDLGRQSSDIKDIKKELKNRNYVKL